VELHRKNLEAWGTDVSPDMGHGEKAFASFIESLKLLEKASKASSVPLLQGTIATALHIALTIQVRMFVHCYLIPLIRTF